MVIKSYNTSACLCETRYKLKKDGTSCELITKFLIFARSWEVRGISLNDSHPHDVMTPILGLSSAIGTDFYAKEEYIYFTDVKIDKIGRVHIGTDTDNIVEWIVEGNLLNPDGVAVDWMGGNLYWTDSKYVTISGSEIGVSKLNGSFRRPLLRGQLGKPRAIVVHPAKG